MKLTFADGINFELFRNPRNILLPPKRVIYEMGSALCTLTQREQSTLTLHVHGVKSKVLFKERSNFPRGSNFHSQIM